MPLPHLIRSKTRLAVGIGLVSTLVAAIPVAAYYQSLTLTWSSYGHDAQHSAISAYTAANLNQIKWQKPVDLAPQYSGGDLFIHYGSPLITSANTVIVPVKTGAVGGYRFDAVAGSNGAAKWSINTDYVLPPHNWTPSVSGCLTPRNRCYFPGAGGTVYYRDNPDANGGTFTGQLCFYGLSTYLANAGTYNGSVFINTPITTDRYGSIYFGVHVTGANPANIVNGIAKIRYDGVGSIAPVSANGDATAVKVPTNCAPALSMDGKNLYIAICSNSNFGVGYLSMWNTTTMAFVSKVRLKDAKFGGDANIPSDGTASPTVGPDGDVYFGVLETSIGTNHDRGYLLHFNNNLSITKTPAAFGWDDTASVVPASMIPDYVGPSSYLLCIKYNNYAGVGGDGVNKVAVVDPNQTAVDPISGVTAMKEIKTVTGVTPDAEFRPSKPLAVREWCINTAAIDPTTNSII
ncbi:MAG: hypothetical protein ABJA67_14005, partial [Chthonomonadales bacterium]